MANLALVTNDKAQSYATRLHDVLVGGGHTVTMFNSSEAVAATLETFDVIVSSYGSNNLAMSNIIKAAFDAGIPVLCNGAVATGSNSVATACRMVSSVGLDSGTTSSIYALVPDYAYTGVAITPPASFTITSLAQSYHFTIASAEAGGVSRIAQRSSTNTDGAILFAPAGSADLDGNPFPANIAFCNFMFMGNWDIGAGAKVIVNNLVTKLLLTGKVFKGIVQDGAGNKLARIVRVYLRQTGKLVAQATSDAVTGAYSLPAIDNKVHYIVCLDAEGGVQNAKIFDRVIAVDP